MESHSPKHQHWFELSESFREKTFWKRKQNLPLFKSAGKQWNLYSKDSKKIGWKSRKIDERPVWNKKWKNKIDSRY